eukprot:jgi/Mesen1/8086/ME000434S07331
MKNSEANSNGRMAPGAASSLILNHLLDVALPAVTLVLLPFVTLSTILLKLAHQTLSLRSVRAMWAMTGKVVLLVGASSGIGEHMAYEFAKRGAKLALVARRAGKLQAVAARCQTLGALGVTFIEADVTKPDECHRFVQSTIDKFGTLDVLALNAGIAHNHLFEDAKDPASLRVIMDTDFWGSVHPTVAALPTLRATHGRIVVTCSNTAFLPVSRFSVYNAAKLAQLQFFDTLRSEPAGHDVSITVGFPGGTTSELTAGKMLGEEGEMVVDSARRDELFGPLPFATPQLVAAGIVSAAARRQRYKFAPSWYRLLALFRLLAPELLFAAQRLLLMPWGRNPTAPSKPLMDAIGGQAWLYGAPAASQEQAEAATRAHAQA